MRKGMAIGMALLMVMMGFIALIPTTSAHTAEEPFSTDLLADQDIPVGEVLVWNDGDYLYVKYVTTDGWKLTKTHLHVADSLEGIPQTKNGNPKPGKFEYKDIHDMETEVLYTIPLGWAMGTPLYIAAHALVVDEGSCRGKAIVYGTERGDGSYGSSGDIYEIDLGAGTATYLYSTGLSPNQKNYPNGNALDTVNNRLYYADTFDLMNSDLYYYDFSTATQVHATTSYGYLGGLVAGASFYNGKYYYVANDNDDLHEVSFDAGGLVVSDNVILPDFTGNTKKLGFGDIVISPAGILYGSASLGGGLSEFFSIDLNTHTYTTIATHGGQQLAYGSDGTLYGHNAGTGEFFTVDVSTGTLTSIGYVTGSVTGQFTDLASGELCEPEIETAWGDGLDFPGKNWATYFTYTVQDEWDLTGSWVLDFYSTMYPGGNPYQHDMFVSDSSASGGWPTGGPYTNSWTATITVNGDSVEIHATYSPESNVYPYQYWASGTIASDGTMSGTWYDTLSDSGTWMSSSGSAT